MKTLLPRVRQATAECHLALERRLGLGSRPMTRGRYVDVLAGFYGFLTPWEEAVRRCPWPGLQAVFADRWRVPLLAADLRHLGVADLGSLPLCAALPSLADRGRALGSCYVMEGSTLGGQVVARQVETALGLAGGAGYSYFRGHGQATGSRWKQFAQWMAEQVPDGGANVNLAQRPADAAGADASVAVDADAVVAGAIDTFAALDAWFAATLAPDEAAAADVDAPLT